MPSLTPPAFCAPSTTSWAFLHRFRRIGLPFGELLDRLPLPSNFRSWRALRTLDYRRAIEVGRLERDGIASAFPANVMPANLTPEYRAAEVAFRKARDPRDRLDCLREMLRVMPKHKGTDHLQGDIRRRIKELSEELERPRRGGGHGGPALVIRPEGAAQIAVFGPPNAGKSSLHARLTGSRTSPAPRRRGPSDARGRGARSSGVSGSPALISARLGRPARSGDALV